MPAKKRELSKISRADYANDPEQPVAWLVIEGEPTRESVQAGKSTVIALVDTEEQADAILANETT